MDCVFDKNSLIINGKRTFIKSGSLHYFHTFGKNEWQDRLSKMKAGGYNTVDLYFCWSFHSPKRGFYDFSDYKNIRELLDIARDLGLFIIARPGPYINAELSGGGIPYWLFKDKNAVIRNRKEGDYVYSKNFMEALKGWYNALLPIIKDFENVILTQVENEYSTNGGETEYIEELTQTVKNSGIKAPVFHNDAYIAGLYSDVTDIYACDIYPFINPANSWKDGIFAFDTLDNLEDVVREFNDFSPLFVAELQAGWYDKWLGCGYENIRENLGFDHINIMTKTAIANGVTIFNHYMAAGGTNILDMAADEVYTSYDFAAPISEFGAIRDNFKKAKEINYFLDAFNLCETEPVDLASGAGFEVCENCFAKIREDKINSCKWEFLRNLNHLETYMDGVCIDAYDMKILPLNLKLKAAEIVKSGLEIFTKLEDGDIETIFIISDVKNSIKLKDADGLEMVVSGDREPFSSLEFNDGNKVTNFIFIPRKISNDAWKIDNKLVFGASFVYPSGKIFCNSLRKIKTYSIEKGFEERLYEPKLDKKNIKLTDFDVYFTAPEIEEGFDYSGWKSVHHNDDFTLCDSFCSDVYSEFVWYKGKISQKVTEISITARHIFAIYINGRELLNRNSYKYDNLCQVDEHLSVLIPSELLEKHENEITILVQNLGFDKGFTNDIGTPRGLIYFKTDTNEKIDWKIRGRISIDKRPVNDNQAPYLALLENSFEIPDIYLSDDVFAPFVLDMNKTPFRRATIFLNDIKIGRFIRNNSPQEKFYLPPHFLKKQSEGQNILKIVVWEKSHRIKSVFDYKNYLENIILKVENYKVWEGFNL